MSGTADRSAILRVAVTDRTISDPDCSLIHGPTTLVLSERGNMNDQWEDHRLKPSRKKLELAVWISQTMHHIRRRRNLPAEKSDGQHNGQIL